jgi:predicted RNase H-like nuclease (RuvC/YqgF family)
MADFSFAQALNEAKQVIVQQASRIKADSEKIKIQQDMLMAQGQTLGEQEKRIREQAADLESRAAEIDTLTQRLTQALTAKEQADAVINRQGEKITSLQNTAADLERKISEQAEAIHIFERDRESLMEQLPTREDAEALAAMSALLMKKPAPLPMPGSSKPGPQMRIADAA